MHVTAADGRDAFLAALDTFQEAAGRLDDPALMAASLCPGWSAADVVTHVHLGLQEMLLGVVSPTDATPDRDAATYWQGPPPGSGDALAGLRFVRRLSSAYQHPRGPVDHLGPTADGLRRAVPAATAPAVHFQGHTLAFGDFLGTWAVELAVHQLDLSGDLARLSPQEEPPVALPAPAALRLTRRTLDELHGKSLPPDWSDTYAVLAGAGRVPDPHFAGRAALLG
jgi:hypothetical protein